MSMAVVRRIDRRRQVLMAHHDALVAAAEHGECDPSAWAQWTMLVDEMEHLVELMRVILMEGIYEQLQSDLEVR